jgi:hypothetical protein
MTMKRIKVPCIAAPSVCGRLHHALVMRLLPQICRSLCADDFLINELPS